MGDERELQHLSCDVLPVYGCGNPNPDDTEVTWRERRMGCLGDGQLWSVAYGELYGVGNGVTRSLVPRT